VIWGWSAYYAAVCSKELYQRVDWSVWQKLWAWARRRHPNKSRAGWPINIGDDHKADGVCEC
jgi:RNA-directed DNA polymerase